MSYILDALRKSEQQRLAGSVPGLSSGQPASAEATTTHRNWLALGIILLVMNVGAIGWWLAIRTSAPAHAPATPELAPAPNSVPAAPPPAGVQAQAAPIPVTATAPVQVPSPSTTLPIAPTPAPQQMPDRSGQDQPATTHPGRPEKPAATPSASRDSVPSSPRPTTQIASPAATASPTAEVDGVPSAPPRGIVAYADLPPAVRNAMPPLKVGGYVDGADGTMLVVDDRLVREGDEFGPGIRVLKISSDGGVFGFRNYRFRR